MTRRRVCPGSWRGTARSPAEVRPVHPILPVLPEAAVLPGCPYWGVGGRRRAGRDRGIFEALNCSARLVKTRGQIGFLGWTCRRRGNSGAGENQRSEAANTTSKHSTLLK